MRITFIKKALSLILISYHCPKHSYVILYHFLVLIQRSRSLAEPVLSHRFTLLSYCYKASLAPSTRTTMSGSINYPWEPAFRVTSLCAFLFVSNTNERHPDMLLLHVFRASPALNPRNNTLSSQQFSNHACQLPRLRTTTFTNHHTYDLRETILHITRWEWVKGPPSTTAPRHRKATAARGQARMECQSAPSIKKIARTSPVSVRYAATHAL